MGKRVLISGGTGLLGQSVQRLLLRKGYELAILSRSKPSIEGVSAFQWDVDAGSIDKEALHGVDHVVHLAGASIADRPWSEARKKVIVDSRVKSAALLLQAIKAQEEKPRSFISASAIGYYGHDEEKLFTEEDVPSDCFLGETCRLWEAASDEIEALGIRRVITRISIILAKEGGALPKMVLPARFGLGSYFGSGKQWYSWIHLKDMAAMIVAAIENEEMRGVYNAASPDVRPNKVLQKAIAKALGRPFIPLPAPAFVLKTAMGEMSSILLNSTKVSASKVIDSGFEFQFPQLEDALADILS